MRAVLPDRLEEGRWRSGPLGSETGDRFGAFLIQGPCGARLKIIASDGTADHDIGLQSWEHVSVSCERRPPNWQEMCFTKDLFWDPEECVVQFHPPKSQYVNCHPHCLHLWRPLDSELPMPPRIMVGPG